MSLVQKIKRIKNFSFEQNKENLNETHNKNRPVKKFNTKGYFHQVEPYCSEYLQQKHKTYEKYRNFIYAQSQKEGGVYSLESDQNLESIEVNRAANSSTRRKSTQKLVESKYSQQRFHTIESTQNIQKEVYRRNADEQVSHFLKKYLTRKNRLLTKSTKGLNLPEGNSGIKLQPIGRGVKEKKLIKASIQYSMEQNCRNFMSKKDYSHHRKLPALCSDIQDDLQVAKLVKERIKKRQQRSKTTIS